MYCIFLYVIIINNGGDDLNYFKSLYSEITDFIKKVQKDSVAAFSAQAAFFMIISAFPLLMLLISIIKYLPFIDASVIEHITKLFPESIYSFMQKILTEIFSGYSTAIIPVSVLAILWAASKGMMSILKGLNYIYGIKEKRNYFFVRILAVIYTVIFIIIILLMLIIIVFGNFLLQIISEKIPSFYGTAVIIASFRTLGAFILLTLFFLILYIVVPNRRASIFTELPGAVLSSLGWLGFSWIYSIYIDNFAKSSYVYGSLAAAVFIMLWLYFCMYIMFIGGEVNTVLRRKGFVSLRSKRKRERLKNRKDKEDNERNI